MIDTTNAREPAAGSATTAPQATTVDDRATEFTAVQGGNERYSGQTLLVEAYAAIWLILMAWLFLLWRKQATLTERLDGLEAAIDRAAKAQETKAKKAVEKSPAKSEKAS
jgi:hypothetical protein